MVKIKIDRVYCIVSKKIISDIKTISFFGVLVYKKEIKLDSFIPDGFDIKFGKLVRVEPWTESVKKQS